MVSSEGGVNIEEVAAKTPELIFKEHFHPDKGLQPSQVAMLCKKLDITGDSYRLKDSLKRHKKQGQEPKQ